MTQIIHVGPNGNLVLPKAIRSRFKANDQVIVFTSKDDTVVLKKIHGSRLSEVALRAKGKPMPLRAIVKEIRKYRQERRNRA